MHTKTLLAVALLSTGPMFAQAPPAASRSALPDFAPWSLKFRLQAGFGNVDGVENALGAGVNYAIPAGEGCFNVELNYQQYFGSNYNVPIPPNTLGLSSVNAVDTRKHSVTGGALRLGYQRGFADDWTWQLGASVNYFTVHNTAHALFGLYGGAGYWDQTIDKTRVTLSPFAGVRWDLNQYSALEFNLIEVSYKEDVIYPIYGVNAVNSSYGTRDVNTIKFEFAYVLKF